MHEHYIEANLACSIDRGARRARIVYTPLHGTGRHTVGEVLPRAGFDVHYVAPQMQPDGAFPEVKFRIPNPEVPESMELVTRAAEQCGADAGFATDPDADRLGVVAPAMATWRCLTGNEIAVLLAAYIIEARRECGTLPARAFMVKTAVTTELLARIARANGVQMIGDLLVGFKYVGDVLDAIERDGCFGAVRGTSEDFLLAAEESNGVLVSPQLRDKDAAGGALLLAELCARLRRRGEHAGHVPGRRVPAVWLCHQHRLFAGHGRRRRPRAGEPDHGRAAPAAAALVEDRQLLRAVDHWDEAAFGAIRSATDRSARNFVRLEYEDGVLISARPSGTEPKIKFYVERVFDPAAELGGRRLRGSARRDGWRRRRGDPGVRRSAAAACRHRPAAAGAAVVAAGVARQPPRLRAALLARIGSAAARRATRMRSVWWRGSTNGSSPTALTRGTW